MRILIATTYRNLIGGVERYLKVLIPGLLERGHEVGLLYEHHYDAPAETIDPANGHVPAWCGSGAHLEDALLRLAEWRPEIVYSQGLEDGDLEGSLLETYHAVLYAHNYLGTCISGRKCHGFPEFRPCDRRFGLGCLALYYPRRCGGLNPATMLQMFRRQSRRHSRFGQWQALLVASRHMVQEFEKNGVRSDQLHLVPLPAAENIAPALSAAKAGVSELNRVLFMGRLTDIKGGEYLVQATARAAYHLHRPLSLTIAGDGPELSRVQQVGQTLGVPIQHLGWVGEIEKAQVLRDTDLLVVPSVWPEPFGLVGLEAGLQGVPAAAFGVGGIPDWLIPGVNGELAPPDPPTSEGLAAAMVRALVDRDHYQRLSRGAQEMARRFSIEGHLDLLVPILANRASSLVEPEFSRPANGSI
jgi:glycosyltransferase involved in cell wall biosynthesis